MPFFLAFDLKYIYAAENGIPKSERRIFLTDTCNMISSSSKNAFFEFANENTLFPVAIMAEVWLKHLP